MMWLQRQDAFKDKFGDPQAPNNKVLTETEKPPPKNEQLTEDAEFR